MLTIRLQRVGKKKFPSYRFIISEKNKDPQDRHVEILGTYNPRDKVNGLVVKEERIKYWLKIGAQTSNTVHNILLKLGIVHGEKRKSVTISNIRRKKLDEKKVKDVDVKKKAKEVLEAKKAEEAIEVEEVKFENIA